ncbi:MAG: efflux RND transporter periplasmic adaptor subunit [bacterium]
MYRLLSVFLITAILFSLAQSKNSNEKRWAIAKRDTLRIELVETGEISSVRSTTVAAPHIWNLDMQIIDMVPEGVAVDSGDVVVQLDKSSLLTNLEDKQAQLEIRQADLRKMLVEHKARISELEREQEMAQYALKLAEVQLEQLKFESDTRKDDGELEVLKAKIARKEAETKLTAQKIINESARKKQELLVFQAQGEVNRIQRQVDELTLRAPIAGMAVYHKDWDGSKPQVGGKIRPGSGIIDIPDLTRMQVKIRANEIDVEKLQRDQKATLSLDAFPDKKFTARLISKTTIADPLERNSQVRIFEALMLIAESDSLLKPGMTAKVRIELALLPDVIVIPAGCIFEIDGKPVVFKRKFSKPVEVQILGRNDYYAAVEGINDGAEVSWQSGNKNVRPWGYQAYLQRLRPTEQQRQDFFTEMEKRQLTFDYEAHRNRPPEPPGGAPGGRKAMLEKFGFPAGDMAAEGGRIQLSPEDLKKLRKAGSGKFEIKIPSKKGSESSKMILQKGAAERDTSAKKIEVKH